MNIEQNALTQLFGMPIIESEFATVQAESDEPVIVSKKKWYAAQWWHNIWQAWLIDVYGYKQIRKPGIYRMNGSILVHPELMSVIRKRAGRD